MVWRGRTNVFFRFKKGKKSNVSLQLAVRSTAKQVNRRRRRRRRRMKSVPEVTPFVLGAVDPFHILCRGSKVPDTNTFPSIAGTLSYGSVPTNNASGQFARGFTSYPSMVEFNTASITAGVATFNTAGLPSDNYTTFRDNFENFRVVSYGIRISCLESITSAKGQLFIAIVPDNFFANLPDTWPTTTGQIRRYLWHQIVPVVSLVNSPMIIAGKRVDDGSYRYRSCRTVPANVGAGPIESTSGWSSIVIFGDGLTASVQSITIEYIANVEATPFARTTIPGLESSVSPVDETQLMAAKAVDAASPVGWWDKVADAGVSIAQQAMNEGSNLIAGIAPKLISHTMKSVSRRLMSNLYSSDTVGLYNPTNFVREESKWDMID